MKTPFTINTGGKLLSLAEPRVMGIINLTPNSFYAESQQTSEAGLIQHIQQAVHEGADILDIGACSTQPGAKVVSTEEEMARLRKGLTIIRKTDIRIPLSIDTFRADVAKMCVEEYGVEIINDISAGEMDSNMFRTVAQLKVPYIMMHMKGTPCTMQENTDYNHLEQDILYYFSQKIQQLIELGVNDIILDPGFGFSKTLEQNYELLNILEDFKELNRPILTGLSRKSMIYKLLQCTPQEALNGTTALNMVALIHGADILRVHDIKAAKEVVQLYTQLKGGTTT